VPRTPSALKALRVSERRYVRNRSVRSALRTYVKKARTSVEGGVLEEAPDQVRLAASQLDKAASKGIIHPNQAARRKSRLMKLLATAGSVSADGETAAAPRASRARAAVPARTGRTAAKPAAKAATPRSKPAAKPAAGKKPAAPRARTAAKSDEDKPAAVPRATRARKAPEK
jgi:small subunit ribosomal protein S20